MYFWIRAVYILGTDGKYVHGHRMNKYALNWEPVALHFSSYQLFVEIRSCFQLHTLAAKNKTRIMTTMHHILLVYNFVQCDSPESRLEEGRSRQNRRRGRLKKVDKLGDISYNFMMIHIGILANRISKYKRWADILNVILMLS